MTDRPSERLNGDQSDWWALEAWLVGLREGWLVALLIGGPLEGWLVGPREGWLVAMLTGGPLKAWLVGLREG